MTFDEMAPNYLRAKDRWPDAPTLANHYEAVASSYGGNSHGLIETVKSFLECVCLTILGEFGKPMPSADPSTTELFVEALGILGLQNSRGASKFDRVLSAHNRLADALSDMRNENGPVAHGKDGFLDCLTSNHMRAFLLTGDTLLSLLLSALDGKDPDLQFTREPYERFPHLHERIDGSVATDAWVEEEDDSPVIVLAFQTAGLPDGVELRVEPSRLLYSIDRAAYVELLAASVVEARAAPPSREISEEPPLAEPLPTVEDTSPAPEVVPSYDGALSSLKGGLQRYLDSLGLVGPTTEFKGTQLVDSLLATAESNMGLDWMVREPLQARMKIAFRRILTKFGVSSSDADTFVGHLVTWFKIQSVGVAVGESETGGGG